MNVGVRLQIIRPDRHLQQTKKSLTTTTITKSYNNNKKVLQQQQQQQKSYNNKKVLQQRQTITTTEKDPTTTEFVFYDSHTGKSNNNKFLGLTWVLSYYCFYLLCIWFTKPALGDLNRRQRNG